ncbi:unnamed protein product [Lactuca virosa]|uniref:Replication factor A C-terminal domain-containing protein n=1 Tax=Lactuca virosa TaxID=75947 RepID=A0AAU9NEY5_9ASTR|nr:unnamed protein product [Lactuca virosa]
MSETFTTISELHYGSPGTALQVRILRTWTPQPCNYETWYLAVDKYGDAIQILGQRKDQGYVQSVLKVSKCYTISNYGCGEPDSYQKWIDNPIYIAIGMASSLTLLPDTNTIPRNWFRFISKGQIPEFVDQSPDFLGIFVKFRSCFKKNGQPFLLLILKNESGQEIAVSLWKECTDVLEKFNRVAIENAPDPTVIAVTNVKITPVDGTLMLGTTSASHICINPTIPESNVLLNSYRTNPGLSTTMAGPPISLIDISEKTRSDLLERTFTIKASVIDFKFTDTWYQVICPTCKKPTFKQGNTWFCPSDGIPDSTTYMFKLSGTITDPTNSMDVTFTDNVLQKLTGTTSEKLIDEKDPDNRKKLPSAVNEIKGLVTKMALQMMKTSTNENLRFIITDVEENTVKQNPTPLTPAPVTPPNTKTTDIHSSSSSGPHRPLIRRSLTYEHEGNAHNTQFSIIKKTSNKFVLNYR